MIWMLLLLTGTAFAQVDLSAIQELDEELPNFTDFKQSDEEINISRQNRRFRPPKRIIKLEEIIQSPVLYGAIPAGKVIRNLESNKNQKVTKLIYVRYYALEDENEFKYILNKDGSVTWRISSDSLEPLKDELSLYVPPTRYTPAPENMVRTVYDKKLNLLPEVSFYTGAARGDFMGDLFDDNKARSGTTTQYGVHYSTQWELPVKIGAVLHFERTSYGLSDGTLVYSSPSFGPQVKTREYEFFGQPIRLQGQFRVSPFARAVAETSSTSQTFEFNSADILVSIERPIKNFLGEFVLGAYYQSQWLNIKDQPSLVNVDASNDTNKSFGIALSQVFQ